MRYRNIFWILILFCILGGLYGNAQAQSKHPLEVSANVDKTTATVGDILTYKLTTNSAPGVSTVLPNIEDELGNLEIIESGVNGPHEKDGRTVSNYWYKLRTSKLGLYTIPELNLAYTLKGEPQDKEIQTKQIVIDVKSVIPEGEKLEDIVDIKALEPLGLDIRFWTMVAVILLIIAIIVGVIIYKRKQQGKLEEIIIKRPAHEVALEGFHKLQQLECSTAEEIKKLYFELSEIFRYYLEDRYDFPASDWTSEEILWQLNKKSELSFEIKGQSREFLSNTDLVKFAEVIPQKEQINMEIQRAVQFVETTKKLPIETEPTGQCPVPNLN